MTAEKKSTSQTNSRSFWHRRSVKILAIIGACILAISLSLPIAARIYLQKWLLDNGADTAIIEKVRFNPFTGVAALEGMNVGKDGNTVFSNSTIYLDVGLKNLFSHEGLLQQVTLADVLVDIESSEDGSIRIGSYSIIAQQKGSDDTAGEVAEQVEKDFPWIFRANTINIQNVTVHYRQPDLDVELVIEEALIVGINTDPNDSDGNLTLKGTVNGAPINLDFNALVVNPEVDIQGNVSLSDFRLDDLADFLGESLKPFSGTAGLDGKIAFAMGGDGDLRVAYDGSIQLDQGDVGGEGWATKGTINYKGKASFAMNQEDMEIDVDGDLQALQAAFDMVDPIIAIANSNISIKGKTSVSVAEEVVVDTSASLKLAAITFDMDTLKTSTGEMTWDGHVRVETGTQTKELAVRADGALNVGDPGYSMDIDGSLMEVSNRMLLWDGKVEYIMGIGTDSTSFVRTDGSLMGETIAFSLPKVIQIDQKGFNFAGKTEAAIGKDIGVSYQGNITLDDTAVEMEGITIRNRQLSWSGAVGYELGSADQTITLDGSLNGEDISTDIADMHISQRSLVAEADCVLSLAESPGFKGTFSVSGEKVEVTKEGTAMLSLAELSVVNAGDNGSGGIIVESLQLKKLDLPASADIPVTVSVPQVVISDIQSPDFGSATIGKLIVEQPLVVDAEGKVELAALKSINADTIKIAKDMSVTVEGVGVEKGVFLKEEEKDALATLAGLQLKQLSYSSEEGLVCNRVELDGVYGNFLRKKSSESKEKQEEIAKTDVENSKVEKTAATIPVKIKQVKVTGKSGFKFIDESLAKTYMTVFAIKSLQVDDIDLNKPEHPFSYSLEGTFDKYSPLNVEGKCTPLAANIILEQKVSLQNFPMEHVSPYTIDAIGTYFPNGSLDYSSELKLGDGRIDMENNLVFTDLEAETVRGELAEELNNKLPIPLDLALTMLRDRHGSIELNIPIDGELSELHVGVTDIIVTALSKGITVAVTPYLAYTFLGPAGALAYVGVKVGQSLLDTDLPFLEFEPGAQDLTEEHKEILKKVGEQIKDDTELRYSICAKVTRDELSTVDTEKKGKQPVMQNEETRRELFELGEHRSILVKDYLLSSFKIDEERLLICNPGFEFAEGSKPTVTFKGSKKN